jgi:hypothetical protein
VTLEYVNPEDLPTPQTYTHVVVATGVSTWQRSMRSRSQTTEAAHEPSPETRSRPLRY